MPTIFVFQVEQVKQTCRAADVPDDSDDDGPSDDEERDGVPERVVENILKLTGALAYSKSFVPTLKKNL